MIKRNTIFAAGITAAALLAQQAQAIPTLTISNGSTTRTIVDNGAGDLVGGSSGSGALLYVGLFANYNFSITAAITKPVAGSATLPYMNLTSLITAGARASGPVTLTFTEDGFTGNPLDIAASIGGTFSRPGSDYEFNTYYSYTDGTGSHTVNITELAGNGTPFGGSDSGSLFSPTSPYSLTMEVIINQPSSSAASFNAKLESTPGRVNVPDGGATALLLGVGLVGLGAFRRRTA